jgi:CHAD domain-containing protein
MGEPELEYRVPETLPLPDLLAGLAAHWRLVEDRAQPLARVFLDTFDWALFLADALLELRLTGASRRLCWLDLSGQGPDCEQEAGAEPPGFASDLPPGPVRDQVAPVSGIRRLLPQIEIHTDSQTLSLRNEDDKTVVRLRVDDNRFRDPRTGVTGPLATRLWLLPLRGYGAELAQAVALIEAELGLPRVDEPLLVEALAAAGRRPADYSSKLDYRLDPETRADVATKEILHGLLETLEANIPGTRGNLDSEFLHDLRVATRRTRAGLTQIRDVFPAPVVEDFKARFAWLQQVTGPVRDLDVYLLGFEGYRAGLPGPLRPHLEPLRDYLQAHYGEARSELDRALDSPQLERLLADWRAFLEAEVPQHSPAPNSARPIKAVADERIWRMLRRVRREGRAITLDSPSPELHELRKSCKKLRYLMEFFQGLYPSDLIRGPIKLLKALLDCLGSFQDLAVQAEHLRDIALRMHAEGDTAPETLLAMGALVGDLYGRQADARAGFAQLFAELDAPDNRALMRGLFAPTEAVGEPE